MQDRIVSWLRSLPGLESMTVERIGELPGCAGLFYQGEQELSRTEDILGNAIRRLRLRWLLVTNSVQAAVPAENAPVLGLMQTVCVEKGHLVHLDAMQIPRWEKELTVEFTLPPEGIDG